MCVTRVARRARSDADAVALLAVEGVQAGDVGFVEAAIATTLEVERRHAQASRPEGSKLRHIACASRSFVLQRFRL